MAQFLKDAYEYMFPPPKTYRDYVREQKRELNKTMVSMQASAEANEKTKAKAMARLELYVKNGNMSAAKTIAQTVANVNAHIQRCLKVMASMEQMSIQLDNVCNQIQLVGVMKSNASFMTRVNRSVNSEALFNFIRATEVSINQMNMKNEMLSDGMDAITLGSEDDIGETGETADEILDKVKTQVGMRLEEDLSKTKVHGNNSRIEAKDPDNELADRLNKLSGTKKR